MSTEATTAVPEPHEEDAEKTDATPDIPTKPADASEATAVAAAENVREEKPTAPATPVRSSGIQGQDFATPSAEEADEAAAAHEGEEPRDEGLKPNKTSDKLASWWRNSAKPGLAAFGESSARGMTIIKQRFSEQMGRSTKTVDLDLQPRIEKLKSITADYAALSHAATAIANNLQSFAAAHNGASVIFQRVSDRKDVLSETFHAQSSFLATVSHNANGLSEACSFFSDQTQQLTREAHSVLRLAKEYDTVRIEYDGYRVNYEKLKAANSSKAEYAEKKYLDAYNKLQEKRVEVLKSLNDFDDDKLQTMRQQLNGLLNAYSMFLSGNQSAVSACLENIQKEQGNEVAPESN